eukprot:CAMPEP_0204472638 /NCGR_PEP_ID=MMETSP0471-20130131/23066_1 /ASSEMBLY_ACC=CAM_ASM_000602 /TAXON_ID=2969 /ORGANISM="Oxyrrhis marina" /LENGTH=98 /DNA_ID=CAMNT_0051474873 /DNA_START=122 /DNA_END=421 /DNA_ORIENTATION=-
MGPRPVQWGTGCLHLVNDIRISDARGLLQIPHEAMRSTRLHNQQGCHKGRHHHLGADHQRPSHDAGVEHLHAGQQVHAFVLSLLKQSVDPTMITTQIA